MAKELQKWEKHQLIILKTKSCRRDFQELHPSMTKTIMFTPGKIKSFITGIYHLATSKVVFIDNYYGFLAAIDFKEGVKCIQLWHAAGAIKRFGLQDPSIHNRSSKAMQRFQDVYKRFDYVIVGSEKMASIFKESFGLHEQNMLRTGIPRTDFFFDEVQHHTIITQLQDTYPIIKEKQVILYAPTFRDGQLNHYELALNIEDMYKALGENYVLFLRLHPAVKTRLGNQYPNFVQDVSSYPNINHLLLITDLLITDYSSIPFEFALLQKPMVFYTYDVEKYKVERGFWGDFQEQLPGPIALTTNQVIQYIQTNSFDLQEVEKFSAAWNEYSYGQSSRNVIDVIYKQSPSEQ
ncbi:CDP-glycerol glycerophosphotransferase family protein [Salirhabdus salicampi]|uniref:CDP-glycerol glycerophosphotransferase family protein n=1 Tax=Salirhabdus salicampi TaxID=476102 RepID=UPI0020C1F4E3|nr:CDP-glycerol glycerophosphotransferase family protein [Salirhabdus salicampi]